MYYEHLSRERDSSFAIMAAPRDDLILVSPGAHHCLSVHYTSSMQAASKWVLSGFTADSVMAVAKFGGGKYVNLLSECSNWAIFDKNAQTTTKVVCKPSCGSNRLILPQTSSVPQLQSFRSTFNLRCQYKRQSSPVPHISAADLS